jgi:hypothetical protein
VRIGLEKKRVLIASFSNPHDENRVKSQIRVLKSEGWEIDTLGFGFEPPTGTTQHLAMLEYKGLKKSRLVRFIIHLFFAHLRSFNALVDSQLPELDDQLAQYDLIVLHDLQLLPLVSKIRQVGKSKTIINVDLHEMHDYISPFRSWIFKNLVGIRLKNYHNWLCAHLDDSRIDLITTVGSEIAKQYEKISSNDIEVIRNCPPYVELTPGSMSGSEIKLIHHGKAAKNRSLEQLVDAYHLLDSRFSLTFMLTGDQTYIKELKSKCAGLARVYFIEPVEMKLVPHALSKFDAEIIFFPPVTRNLEYTFPNKFFEAVQGRIGVIAGPSIELQRAISQFNVGVVASEWTAMSLANAINDLSVEEFKRFKDNSNDAAKVLNAEKEWGNYIFLINGYLTQKSL